MRRPSSSFSLQLLARRRPAKISNVHAFANIARRLAFNLRRRLARLLLPGAALPWSRRAAVKTNVHRAAVNLSAIQLFNGFGSIGFSFEFDNANTLGTTIGPQ